MFGLGKAKAKAKPRAKAKASTKANDYNRAEGWVEITAPDGIVWRWQNPPGTVFDALDLGRPPPILSPPPFDPNYPEAERTKLDSETNQAPARNPGRGGKSKLDRD